MLKKINALLSVLITILLFYHTVSCSLWLLSDKTIPLSSYASLFLLLFVIFHGGLSTVLLFSHHDGTSKEYRKKNRRMFTQRISAVFIILFLFLHLFHIDYTALGTSFEDIGVYIVLLFSFCFFLSLTVHISTSFSRALITLGAISDTKTVKIIDIISIILCIMMLLLSVTTFILYFKELLL